MKRDARSVEHDSPGVEREVPPYMKRDSQSVEHDSPGVEREVPRYEARLPECGARLSGCGARALLRRQSMPSFFSLYRNARNVIPSACAVRVLLNRFSCNACSIAWRSICSMYSGRRLLAVSRGLRARVSKAAWVPVERGSDGGGALPGRGGMAVGPAPKTGE